MKSVLTMKYPTAGHGEMWREAAPCGNGMVGALVYGSVDWEYIMLNHAHLCDIRIRRVSENPVYGYRRKIDLTKAEVTVRWEEDGAVFTRSTFVSCANNLCYTRIACTVKGKISIHVGLDIHDPETMYQNTVHNPEIFVNDDCVYYASDNNVAYAPASGSYGAVMRVISHGGTCQADERSIRLSNTDEVVLVTGVFVGAERKNGFADTLASVQAGKLYEIALAEHAVLHQNLYDGVEFSISDIDTSVEEMLLDAYGSGASNELMESMYAYGRYLFVCSTGKPVEGAGRSSKQMLLTHLTGLWNGTYQCFWAIHMFNVNFEMIYWQALS